MNKRDEYNSIQLLMKVIYIKFSGPNWHILMTKYPINLEINAQIFALFGLYNILIKDSFGIENIFVMGQ